MPNLTNKLLRDAVVLASTSGKSIEIAESAGLIALISVAGTVTFCVRYRVGRARRRFKLGRWPKLTIDEGRKLAREKLGAVDKGEDPQAERRRARERLTLEQAFARFVDEPGKRGARKPRTLALYRQIFASYLAPLGATQLDQIERRDAERLKTRVAKEVGEAVANRVLALLSAIYGAAERWDEVDLGVNPCRGVTRYREQGLERFLRPDERARLWRVLDVAESASRGHPLYLSPGSVAAVRLLALTGMRKSEVTSLTWSMVDLAARALYLPDSKTGRKTVPLSPPAVTLLAALAEDRDGACPLVCPSEVGTPVTNLGRVWTKVRSRAGIPDVRLHDLRHSAASDALNAGVPLAIVGKMLGHADPKTTARYAHVSDDALRRGVDALGEAHERAIADNPESESD